MKKNLVVFLVTLFIAAMLGAYSLLSPKDAPISAGGSVTRILSATSSFAMPSSSAVAPSFLSLPQIGDSSYRHDDTHVYLGTVLVPGVDLATFAVIDNIYAKDKNQVYEGYNPLTHSDPSTFMRIDGIFAKDKNNVYAQTSSGHVNILEDADPATFEQIPFVHDKANVYVESGCDGCYQKIQGADSNTYESLEYGFGRDKDHVFYGTQIVPEADPETFMIHPGGKYESFYYAYDQKRIFIPGEHGMGVIDGNEYDTLRSLRGDYLMYDGKVYYGGSLLKEADPDTFSTYGNSANYAVDSKNVYFDGKIIGADPATFSMGDGMNVTDKDHTYRLGKIVK